MVFYDIFWSGQLTLGRNEQICILFVNIIYLLFIYYYWKQCLCKILERQRKSIMVFYDIFWSGQLTLGRNEQICILFVNIIFDGSSSIITACTC